ncbi:MAG: TlyA family RNA methyltransferase [Puniceicoccales bacterium]|jgi:23S rRNA (cytidine1920-2'-O)/16S rRNA (cytidine1409-2'-O)-methyltransferase|nr:TlyA family RNA methyltransferase [Puniceicoccales bacterium]
MSPEKTEKTKKIRADELLVLQGKVPSRAAAKALIMAGKVRSGPDSVVAKPAALLPADAALSVEQPPRFVGRAGEKLACALEHFAIGAVGAHALDVGASTGGFTDCLLQNGAADVVCVDVGRGQLHAKLRDDPRVVNLEKINARALDTQPLPRDTFDIVVMDVSFISLTKVLVPVWARVAQDGWLVALIKPQFEADKAAVDKGSGVIRDAAIHARVVEGILDFIGKNLIGAVVSGVVPSPIEGGDGNREFLVAARKLAGIRD